MFIYSSCSNESNSNSIEYQKELHEYELEEYGEDNSSYPDESINTTDNTDYTTQSVDTVQTTQDTVDDRQEETVQIISITDPAPRNSIATLEAKVSPSATAEISVHYESGDSTAQGLEPQQADSSGWLRYLVLARRWAFYFGNSASYSYI
jgi:hypothetical protein